MNIKTVAESVENADILAALLLVGVDFAQGYHISRPLPMMDIGFCRPQDAGEEAAQAPSLVMSASSNV
jgi:EAL domain-containing protein (putative c-di-GMP-specific phosphodiesterase class I)